MSMDAAIPSPPLLAQMGDFRWLRAHISTFCVGAIMLACVNLLLGGSTLWSLTAIGIWIMLLVVHVALVAISRLSQVLMADDEDEIVLLPVKDAIIVDPLSPSTVPTSYGPQPEKVEAPSPAASGEKVSWTVATDAAQAKRPTPEDLTP